MAERFQVRTNVILHGTSNPIVNRMALQFMELIDSNFFDLSKERADEVKSALMSCMEELLHMYDALAAFVALEDEHVERVRSEDGYQVQQHGVSFDDPTARLEKLFEDFLIRGVVALRKLRKIAHLLTGEDMKKGNSLRNYLLREVGNDPDDRKWIEEDDRWVKELIDLRGEVEHGDFKIGAFSVLVSDAGEPSVTVTTHPGKKVTLREFMRVGLYNAFTHCEDTVALLLRLRLRNKPMIELVQIPEDERPLYRGFRYILLPKNLPGVVRSPADVSLDDGNAGGKG
jgi:hypothetical protein